MSTCKSVYLPNALVEAHKLIQKPYPIGQVERGLAPRTRTNKYFPFQSDLAQPKIYFIIVGESKPVRRVRWRQVSHCRFSPHWCQGITFPVTNGILSILLFRNSFDLEIQIAQTTSWVQFIQFVSSLNGKADTCKVWHLYLKLLGQPFLTQKPVYRQLMG